MSITDLTASGPLLVACVLALAAGAVSFASPCSLPLVPGYLGYLAGLVGSEVPDSDAAPGGNPRAGRWRVAGAALLFVAGFTVVFAAAVLLVLGLSDALLRNELLLQRLGGIVTVAMGLVFLGLVPALQRDLRLHRTPRGGLAAAPLLGAVYGLGWTPCLGPTLTAVIALASGTQIGSNTARGLVLVLAYCLGLGLPFVLLALGARAAVRATSWMRRHVRALQRVGGTMLVAMGLLLATGAWGAFVAWLRGPIGAYTLPI